MPATDTLQMNNHIFTKGNIQVSPQHLQMLNMKPPVPYKSSLIPKKNKSGYKVFLSGYADYVLNREVDVYRSTMLRKFITSLESNPRPIQNGYLMKNTVDTRMMNTGAFTVWYKVASGQVIIFNIEVEDEAQNARDRLEKPGLYKIKKNGQGTWVKDDIVSQITTGHAAVNGQSNNLNKATWLMGAHLDFEYGKSVVNEYTLYHNPSIGGGGDTWESMRDKMGFTTDVTKQFSKVLQESQKQGKEIKWIAHSQGGAIFAEGVRYFLNGNSSWAVLGGFNGVFKDKENISLDNHKVAFHGNANNNARSKLLFDRAGIEVVATRTNDYDFVGNVIGMNTLNPRKLIGSVIYGRHVFSGSVQQSPHTMVQSQEGWENNMSNGPGRGRSILQKGFESVNNAVDSAATSSTFQNTVQYINNFLI